MRVALLVVLAATIALPVAAEVPEQLDLEGTWVVLRTAPKAQCRADRVGPSGAGGSHATIQLAPGELARVTAVRINRREIVLRLDLDAPVLLPEEHDGYTLYRRADCQVDVKAPLEGTDEEGNGESLEAAILPLVERFADRASAVKSSISNGRTPETYPPGYKEALAREIVRRAAEHDISVVRRRETALAGVREALSSLPSDASYLDGFTAGLQVVETSIVSDYYRGTTRDVTMATLTRQPPAGSRDDDSFEDRQWRRGFEDAQRLTLFLAISRGLRDDGVSPMPSGS